MEIAIYLHIPFCLSKCRYCDFHSIAGAGNPLIPEYLSMLGKEMELRGRLLEEPVTATTIYIGGGTPSLMEPRQVGGLIDAATRFFPLSSTPEITLEANPGTITLEKLAGYREKGVNRLSLGVQTFHDGLLTRLGRAHTAYEARSAFASARLAGFANIGIDLINSLPGQTPQMWQDDLAEAIRLSPEHISVYSLTIEDGTPFSRLVKEGTLTLPKEDDSLQMFHDTSAILERSGYEHYEISNFARPGYRSRHNQVYWRRAGYLGFGSGAHSFLPLPGFGVRWYNGNSLEEYSSLLRREELPEKERTILSRKDAMAEWLFLGLRLREGVNRAGFGKEFGISLDAAYPGIVSCLTKTGLVEEEGEMLRISDSGLALANEVFRSFI